MTKRFDSKRNSNKRRSHSSKDTASSKVVKESTNTALNTNGRDNDPNWYFTDANIAKLAASISFGEYLGVPSTIKTHYVDTSDNSKLYSKYVHTPSIMSIGVSPCPGDTDSTQKGINLAALKMYSELSSMNAKATSYAPQDLIMLMLSLGEVISVTEHIRRAFGVAFTYNMRNRDLPTRLLQAMGFEPTDFLNNLAAHRLQFNTLITAINKIPFLSNIAYFYKCADLFQKVYTDDPSVMSQIIILKPETTWTLNEAYNNNGSGLVTTNLPTPNTAATFASWMTTLKAMVDKLFQSATFNYIYSDVLNYSTKKGASLLFLDYLEEGYSVVPEFNMNFLLQIHNSTIVGDIYKPTSLGKNAQGNDVSCDANKNQVVYRATFKTVNRSSLNSVLFDFPTDSPSVEDIIEASRFTALGSTCFIDTDTSKTVYYYGTNFPDHYFNNMYVIDTSNASTPFIKLSSSIIDAKTTFGNGWYLFSFLTKFDWAPLMYIIADNHAAEDGDTPVFGDTSFFTTIDSYWLTKVNDIAMLSLFTLR